MPEKTLPKDLEMLVSRYDHNPIISRENVPFGCASVFNPGAIKFKNKYCLLLRIQDRKLTSHFVLATSDNGIVFEMSKGYAFSPKEGAGDHRGVEDPRITQIGDDYYLTYTAYSRHGASVGLAQTKDFKEFKRLGLIFPPENKDAVLLPEKVDEKYFIYHRPSSSMSMWAAKSPDLVHWGENVAVLDPDIYAWDAEKVGAGAVPIKTEKGWLQIYHGVAGKNYRLGVALFDLNDPSKLIRRSKNYILAPEKDYERTGEVNNVVFTCGAILEDNGEVKIYYGGADTCVCLATAKLSDLIAFAEEY